MMFRFARPALLWLLACGIAHAAPAADEAEVFAAESEAETEAESESADLPDVPDPEGRGWFELYVAPTHRGRPEILLESIRTTNGNTIRYILNRRSAAGSHNVSLEGMRCEEDLFGSEGAQHRVFAYADLYNQTWVAPRNSHWQPTGNKLTGTDPIRQVLYDAFCTEGRAKNDQELRRRIRNEAGHLIQKDYSK